MAYRRADDELFGKYCYIDTPWIAGKHTVYRIIRSGVRSNSWCEVPINGLTKKVNHGELMEDIVFVILDTLIDEDTKIIRVALKDIQIIGEAEQTEPQTKYPCDTCVNKGDHDGECSNCVSDSEVIKWKTPSHYKPKTEPSSSEKPNNCEDEPPLEDGEDYLRGYQDGWNAHDTITRALYIDKPRGYTLKADSASAYKKPKDEPQTDFSHPCYCCANNNICEFAFTDAVKICRYVYKPQAERSE